VSSNNIDLAKLQALQVRNINAKGILGILVHGQGTFDAPKIDADLQIPALTINGHNFFGTKLKIDIVNDVANADLSSSIASTFLHAKAKINISNDYLADVSFDTQMLSLQQFFAIYAPEQATNINGQTEIHAMLHGSLKRMDQLEVQLTIPVLKIGYSNSLQLVATSPIHANLKSGVIDIQPVTFRGTGADLQLQGSIPLKI
jgi:autotransporter translocation and assembly factor TamB